VRSHVTSPAEKELWAVVASSRNGILATIDPDGTPQMSNIYYVADPDKRVLRISTTSRRAKGRNLLQTPRAALHVPGADFFNFVVASGGVTFDVAAEVGDIATDELYAHHAAFHGDAERPTFDLEMIEAQRMIVRLHVAKLYGLLMGER